MELPVRFLYNMLSVSILFLFYGCGVHKPVEQKKISITNPGLKRANDIVLYNGMPFTGTVYTLYPGTTDTAIISNYHHGKEDSEWKKFYEKGKLKEKREFDKGRKTGNYIAYWDNGKKQLEYTFKDDEYEGCCREWNRNGMLIKEMNYKKGHEEGSQKVFYDNGNIRSNYMIMNGRRFGLLGTKNCVNVSDSVFKK
jgi:antitoxin component YwqK of YwqJK toxin-antitoxin module